MGFTPTLSKRFRANDTVQVLEQATPAENIEEGRDIGHTLSGIRFGAPKQALKFQIPYYEVFKSLSYRFPILRYPINYKDHNFVDSS